jgi:hypothetical protein
MKAPADCDVRRLPPGYEALGLVADFLSRGAPYDTFPARTLVQALKTQIAGGNHIAAVRDGTLAGYAGWVPVREENGEAWLAGKAELEPIPAADAEAYALSIVRIEDPALTWALIRAVRNAVTGHRVFFRRDYAGRLKRQSVHIFRGAPFRGAPFRGG